jgi:hypothetical protein
MKTAAVVAGVLALAAANAGAALEDVHELRVTVSGLS